MFSTSSNPHNLAQFPVEYLSFTIDANMQSSTPSDGKKTGRLGKSQLADVVSPIKNVQAQSPNIGYSKRERKPKKWDGFETGNTTETRPDSKEIDIDNKLDIMSDSVEILIEEQDSPVTVQRAFSPGKKGSRKPKGKQKDKGRRKKIETDYLESTDVHVLGLDIELDSEKNNSGKKKTSIQANTINDICNTFHSDVNGCTDKTHKNSAAVMETVVTDGGDLNNSDERLTANPEEIRSLHGAVENKRTTKFIEKCDRVMIRTESEYGEHENDTCDKVSKINVSNSEKSNGNIARTDQVSTPKKTPGRRRGRPRKSSVEADNSSIQNSALNFDNRNESITEAELTVDSSIDTVDKFKTPVRRRGRQPKIAMENDEHNLKQKNDIRNSSSGRSRAKKVLDNELDGMDDSVKIESVTEAVFAVDSSLDTLNSSKTLTRRRGRPPKKSKEKNENSVENTSESLGSTRRGRKRKVDYAALDDGNLVEEAGVKEVVRKRPKIKKEQPCDGDNIHLTDGDEDGNAGGNITHRKKRTPIQEKLIKCQHCEYEGLGVASIRRHCAVHHQVWWTVECPEGKSDKQALNKIIKIKKFLNCTKCNKQINFITYYPNHIEWCGLEHLTYSCEHCKKEGLMLRWQHVHMKSCPVLMAQFRAEIKEEKDKELEKCKDNDEEKTTTTGRGKQRKAAKKAMSMVHNISKDMDPSAYSDQSDIDPDAVIQDDDDDAGDDDDDEDIDISDDESICTPDENDGDFLDSRSYDKGANIGGPFRDYRFGTTFNPFPLMEEYMKENWSDELFMDWLPRKRDWTHLSESDSESYLPTQTSSIRFSFRRKDIPISLETYGSQNVADSPMFNCGLFVWRLAWCPVPFGCSDEQVLAITGKLSDSEAFATDERLSTPGVIQIWNTAIKSNIVSVKAVPKLCYNMVHDFGLATQMSWCASGCYKSNEKQVDASIHTRLGLLAVSFTDGTCRIFSLPYLAVLDVGEAPTYRVTPVLTLIPYLGYEMDEVTCSCVDWIQAKGHTKVLVGYSNGAVRLFNLVSTSPLQCLITSDGPTLLPYRNIQPHGNLVRAACWCSDFENIIVTSSESFDTAFWDITNTGEPLHEDGGYMTMSMSSTIMQHGMYITADENYAILSNKGRFVDSGNMMYLNKTAQRKDERTSYYITSQPACIWDVSCSNWHTLVAACDNRGCIHGYIIRDLMKVIPDSKSYKYRQVLLKTKIKEDKKIKTTETKSDSTQCQKCSTNQSGDSLHNMDDESETSLKCTCDETDQSNCTNNLTNKKKTVDHVTADSGTKKMKDYHVLADKSVLHFEEYHKVTKYHPLDKDSDLYDRKSIAAIKSISFNPNRLQCCWLAYGGNSGLVRLVNVQNIMHTSAHKYLKDHKYI